MRACPQTGKLAVELKYSKVYVAISTTAGQGTDHCGNVLDRLAHHAGPHHVQHTRDVAAVLAVRVERDPHGGLDGTSHDEDVDLGRAAAAAPLDAFVFPHLLDDLCRLQSHTCACHACSRMLTHVCPAATPHASRYASARWSLAHTHAGQHRAQARWHACMHWRSAREWGAPSDPQLHRRPPCQGK